MQPTVGFRQFALVYRYGNSGRAQFIDGLNKYEKLENPNFLDTDVINRPLELCDQYLTAPIYFICA